MYMSMQRPMTKTSVKALCRLVELLKVCCVFVCARLKDGVKPRVPQGFKQCEVKP